MPEICVQVSRSQFERVYAKRSPHNRKAFSYNQCKPVIATTPQGPSDNSFNAVEAGETY